jgi:hypothetical protein
MGPVIGSQMTLIGAVQGGLSKVCSSDPGRCRSSRAMVYDETVLLCGEQTMHSIRYEREVRVGV